MYVCVQAAVGMVQYKAGRGKENVPTGWQHRQNLGCCCCCLLRCPCCDASYPWPASLPRTTYAGPQRSALDAVQRAAAGGGGSASAARRAAQRYIARCHVFDICQVGDGEGWQRGWVRNADSGTGVMPVRLQVLPHRAAPFAPGPCPRFSLPALPDA